MATNTHIPVRSARRCILRSVVTKLSFATAVAIATCAALALSGELAASPRIVRATGPLAAQAKGSLAAEASKPLAARPVSGQAYGYPVKPFDREHLIRANFGDPRMQFHGPPTADTLTHADGSFSFHQGVDISAPGGTAVYPVVDGTVTFVSREWIRVTSGSRGFEYWHIRPLVRNGQQVTARHTLLGRVTMISNHVHLTEYEGGHVVNPLVPGRLTPYHDSTRPVVRAITFRGTDDGADVLPIFVRGRVEIDVEAEDDPGAAGFHKWFGPVTPALITWRIRSFRTGRDVVRQRVARDVRNGVPPNSFFWHAYARGTYQNQMVFGNHYTYVERGRYLFKLAQHFDTRTLRDGVYDLIVKASDVRGNTGSQTLRFTVHNRPGWAG
jgi:hypothetical protein